MKTKYYVNGKLVRTSSNPDYKYGIMYYYFNQSNEKIYKLVACSTTLEKITKRYYTEYRYVSNDRILSSNYGWGSKEKADRLQIVELETK